MKKILALLFVCSFTFVMFSGCSESPTEPDDPAPTATPVPPTPAPTSTPTFTPPEATLKYEITGTSQAMMVGYGDAWGNTIYAEGLIVLPWEVELPVGAATTAVGAGGFITDTGNAQVFIYKNGTKVGESPVFTQADCGSVGYSYLLEGF